MGNRPSERRVMDEDAGAQRRGVWGRRGGREEDVMFPQHLLLFFFFQNLSSGKQGRRVGGGGVGKRRGRGGAGGEGHQVTELHHVAGRHRHWASRPSDGKRLQSDVERLFARFVPGVRICAEISAVESHSSVLPSSNRKSFSAKSPWPTTHSFPDVIESERRNGRWEGFESHRGHTGSHREPCYR